MSTLDITTMSATDLADLVAQVRALDEATKAAQKAQRETSRNVTSRFLADVIFELPEQTFTSGARGYSLGGSKFTHGDKTYRVSVLIRDEATIPAKEA